MDWDDLKYFLAVTRSDTISDAAAKLSVNQTTVSRRLKRFQHDIGVRLLHHNTAGFDITHAGTQVSQAAQQIETIIAALQRKLSGLDERVAGTLRITTVEYMASLEGELFKSFIQAYPELALEISTSESNEDLLRGDADIALRWTNNPSEHLVGRKLCRAEFALYGHSRQFDKHQAIPLDSAALSEKPWLAWDESCGAKITDAWMKRQVPDAVIHCRINSAMAMYHAVKSGLGIAFLPCAYADTDTQLHRLRDVEKGFGMDIWALTHPDQRSAAKIRAFFQHAEQYFSAHRQRYAGRQTPSSKALVTNTEHEVESLTPL